MIKGKANIAVFISGRGTNLKALILRSKKKKCNYKVVYVVSNKKNAVGLKIAKKKVKIFKKDTLKKLRKYGLKIFINPAKQINFIFLLIRIFANFFCSIFKND